MPVRRLCMCGSIVGRSDSLRMTVSVPPSAVSPSPPPLVAVASDSPPVVAVGSAAPERLVAVASPAGADVASEPESLSSSSSSSPQAARRPIAPDTTGPDHGSLDQRPAVNPALLIETLPIRVNSISDSRGLRELMHPPKPDDDGFFPIARVRSRASRASSSLLRYS